MIRDHLLKAETRSSTETSMDFYNNPMDEDFLKAAKSGNQSKVEECIKNNIDIHITNPGGLNALHFASRENHPSIAKLVLHHGIDINRITKRLNTALHIASLGGHSNVVKILVEHGAPVNVQAKDDITPLYMAAQENHIDVVKLLLKNGSNPHIAAKGGFEPVDIAVQQGHSKVAAMLLEHETKQGLRALHMATKKDDVSALKLLIDDKWNVNERASNGYTPLHIAAKHGSVNAANYLIDHGAELNSPAKHNIVALHVAARHGQMGVLTVLIEAGANLSISTKDGLSALHCAARDGHSHSVELLLVHGAPITAKTKHGLTALHTASQGNHTASANHLLAHGAHIDDVTLDGVTPLHITAHYGHLPTAQLLVEKGADIDLRARNGYTSLHIAAKKNRENIVQLLLKAKTSVHIKNNNGQTALHVAAFFGHVNIVLLLMQNGASLEAKTIREETVLHIACRTIQIQIVRLLLRNNAKVNSKSKEQDTPLHIACLQGSTSLVSLLLDNEADPNAVNMEGCSALHLASRDGHGQIVESLLDHKADVSMVSKRGFTPTHEASKKGHVQILDMLLAKKADVNTKGKNGLTPLHIACHYDQPDAAMRLLHSGADPHATAKNGFTCLHICSKKNQVNIVSLLLERGVEADMTTRNGVSPLHLAAKEGNADIVDMLLEHGASPGVETVNGLTPLHIAVQYNQIEVVKRLIKYGAAINTQTQSGFSPLHLAALNGQTDVAEILLEEGADVEAKTKNGNTPLHLASNKGHHEIIELLLRYNAPPNALNKDGYSSLYIAEIMEHKLIIVKLFKVTKVNLSKKYLSKQEDSPTSKWKKIRNTFLSPESLEETILVDARDEAEDEAHIQKKIIQEDFEETFAGLDETKSDTRSETRSSKHMIIEEEDISFTQQHQVESTPNGGFNDYLAKLDDSTNEHMDSFIDGLDNSMIVSSEPVSTSKGSLNGLYNGDKKFHQIDRDVYKNGEGLTNGFESNDLKKSPLKEGGFLISFNIDARGGVMESKQTAVKLVIPRGACEMPLRITCRLKRPTETMSNKSNLSLNFNESIVSQIVQLSPDSVQFLKPVIIEIPHRAALNDRYRELVVLRRNTPEDRWQEHTSTLVDEQNGSKLKVILQDLPEKLVIISRPIKQRCLMQAEGGTIESKVVSNTQIIFPPNTLNTSTKVVLQVQPCDDSLLQVDDQTFLSPIVSLSPPTVLSKPITINIPCPWLAFEERNSKRNLRLLGWVARSPRKSVIEHTGGEYEWQDITNKTALSIIGENASFTTTDFTRYWLIQTNSVETLLKRVNHLQATVSVAPYSCRIRVYARLKTSQLAHIRVDLSTDDERASTHSSNDHSFQEIGQSDKLDIYNGQTIYVNLSGNLSQPNVKNLKLSFTPFQINRLNIFASVVSPDVPRNCRLTFIGSLRQNSRRNSSSSLCSIDLQLNDDMLQASRYLLDTVNDSIIQTVGQDIKDDWYEFADGLGLNNRDKQAVCDISCGKKDLQSIRLLEFWRSKNPSDATYKNLYDALKRHGNDIQAQNVINQAPNEFSLDIEPRIKVPNIVRSPPTPVPYIEESKPQNENIEVSTADIEVSRIDIGVSTPDIEVSTPDIEVTTADIGQNIDDSEVTTTLFDPSIEEEDITNSTDIKKDACDEDVDLFLQNNVIQLKDPEIKLESIDFDDILAEIHDNKTDNSNDNVEPSPYELSLQRKEQEEQKNISDSPGKQPNRILSEEVMEDLVNDLQVNPVESEMDFSMLEEQNNDPQCLFDQTDNVEVKQYAEPEYSLNQTNITEVKPSTSQESPLDQIGTREYIESTDKINSNVIVQNHTTVTTEEKLTHSQVKIFKTSEITVQEKTETIETKHSKDETEANSLVENEKSDEDIIKRVFGNQSSVLDFFNEEIQKENLVAMETKRQTTV